ncbi:hypothetical protein GCM10022403_048320 [Streptomyces coacervatus]|uniref:Galactose oxidase n=1 Tax=Streptomyces coacervatus TaxID=647381 RepID=A0ABP7I3B9_9ACTN|nr:kelch repeat-containing protein [Streptomyces coacervatus]MDF2266318.1 kelch repeat-containing protein [Streptomyces coacervatus]
MGHTLTYDLARNRCVLFGGTGEGTLGFGEVTLADTWAWDGT